MLDRILAFDRALHERAVTRVVPTAVGPALLFDPAPSSWDLNFVAVDAPPEPSAFALIAQEADRVQVRLAHRLAIVDADVPELARAARAAGWQADCHVAMVAARDPDPSREPAGRVDPVAEEVTRDAIRELRAASLREWSPMDDATVEEILLADAAIAEVGGERVFATREDGRIVAAARLYADAGARVGQIEDVFTAATHRGRGHGRAVVLAALAASRAAGHDLTFLWADAADWPARMYGRLGFDEIGRRWRLRRSLSG
jgi:GNAT superfamily N-acetyltransferase